MNTCFVIINLGHFLHKSIKGQALTNFLANHPSLEIGTYQKCGAGNLWRKKGALDPQI